jgi:serine/threonine protein kinase
LYNNKAHVVSQRFLEVNGINCFERWTVPYFVEREKERKRPCLRLNYPHDGRCQDCSRNACRYDTVCFLCGQQGHGAFQTYPGGKMKGDFKCTKHRNFISQLQAIRRQYGYNEDDIRNLLKDLIPAEEVKANVVPVVTAPAAISTTEKKSPTDGKGTSVAGKTTATSNTNATANAAPTSPTASSASTVTNAKAGGAVNGNGKPVTAAMRLQASLLQTSVVPPVGSNSGTPRSGSETESDSAQLTPNVSNDSKPDSSGKISATHSPSSVGPAPVVADNKSAGLTNNSSVFDGPAVSSLNESAASQLPHIVSKSGIPNDNGNSLKSLVENLNSFSLNAEVLGSSNGNQPSSGLGLGAAFGMGGSDWSRIGASTGGLSGSTADMDDVAAIMSGLTSGGSLLQHQMQNQGHTSKLLSAMYSSGAPAPLPGFGLASHHPPMQSAYGLSSPNSILASFPTGMNNLGLSSVAPGIVSVEVTECDEVGSTAIPILRFSQTQFSKDGPSHQIGCFKGNLSSSRGNEDVVVTAWSKSLALSVDSVSLKKEIRALRMLSKSSQHVCRILNQSVVEASYVQAAAGKLDLYCLISEHTKYGYLEQYMESHLLSSPEGFSMTDLHIMSSQLFDAVICCHQHKICHRDIKPSNIIVCPGGSYQTRQFGPGLVLKLTDFRLSSLGNASGYTDPKGMELDKFTAPEVDSVMKNTGVGYFPFSDYWSLALVIYFISTGGSCPIESHHHAKDLMSSGDEETRKVLEKHCLHERAPMVHDLVERLLRIASKRANLPQLRCHPFMWSNFCKKRTLMEFASASAVSGVDSIDSFMAEFDRFCPHYVFGKEGWVAKMSPSVAAHIQPPFLKNECWLSGRHLLQAIKNQLAYPEALQTSLFPNLSLGQTVVAYLRQITEHDFPRLLILIFELGGVHGRWEWDGDDVHHYWK